MCDPIVYVYYTLEIISNIIFRNQMQKRLEGKNGSEDCTMVVVDDGGSGGGDLKDDDKKQQCMLGKCHFLPERYT
jgi:hypothetical protein